MALLAKYGKVGARKAKPVSNRTQDKREEVLFLAFNTLRELGYGLQRAQDLGERHVRVLMEHWESEGLSASTLQNRLSVLRTFAKWVGKSGMVKGIECYLKDPSRGKRTVNAQYDHSWSAAGIDVATVVRDVTAYDRFVGMQLELMYAFMLRREEAIMFRPNRADAGSHITVRKGTKGGRERLVRIDTAYQRDVLDRAKKVARTTNGHVGHPDRNLKQALSRFNYVVGTRFGLNRRSAGVTSHGLRHQGLNDLFERLSGIASPVRGKTQELTVEVDDLRVEVARARVAEVAGHSRLSITGAYLGGRLSKTPSQRMSAEEQHAWVRLYELKLKADARTRDEYIEMDTLVERLLRKVGGIG
jgi:site-specific recombinase XerD